MRSMLLVGWVMMPHVVIASTFHHRAATILRRHIDMSGTKDIDVSGTKDFQRNLQNVCPYVDRIALERDYELSYGVSFSCSCQQEANSSNGFIACETNEPYCCPDDSGEITQCENSYVRIVFGARIEPIFGVPYGETLEATTRVSYTAGPRAGSEVVNDGEFWSCPQGEAATLCTCEATFDTEPCAECTSCDGGTESMYDCSNVESSMGLIDDTCTPADVSGCTAQANLNDLPTSPPTPLPTNPNTSPPTPVPTIPNTSPPTPVPTTASAGQPTNTSPPTAFDSGNDELITETLSSQAPLIVPVMTLAISWGVVSFLLAY